MIAELAIETGQSPVDLLAADARLFDALVVAAERRWTTSEELLAQLLELVHAFWRTYLAAHTPKGTRLPDPLVVPRPGVQVAAKPKVSPRAFAQSFASRRARRA